METNNQKNDQNIIPNDADKQQKGVNVPNLRFECFSSTWHHCLLNDCVIFLDEQRKPIKEADRKKIKGEYPYYGASGIIDNINSYIFDDDLILLSEDGANILDRNYRVSFIVRGKIWVNNHAHVLKPKNKIDINYLSEYLENLDYAKYNTGSAQPKLNQDVCKNIIINIPDYNEQQKIGKFLSIINQRIDTQSKIIEDLQTLKISICDKVFEDTTYPEYKLKDVLSERIEKSNVNNQYEILSSTIKGLFTQKEYFDKDIASSNNIGYKIVHLYDIIISPQNLWMGNITFNQRFTNGLVSPSYKIYIINNNFDMYYIANMLKTKRAMYKYICSSQQGASVVRRNLNMDDFLSLSFNIPDIIKQRKIGLLLNTIDKRIDLEQTYLTKLNQQKKFLLKNMFI